MRPIIYWFRKDLRLEDQPALTGLARSGQPVVPVFIWAPHEEGEDGQWAPGAASRVALHQALGALGAALEGVGSRLILARTRPAAGSGAANFLQSMAKTLNAAAIHCTPRFDPAGRAQEENVELALRSLGIPLIRQGSPGLYPPWESRKADATPYRVFTPFYKNLQTKAPPALPLAAPALLAAPATWPASEPLKSLALLPAIGWDSGFAALGPNTPAGGRAALASFLGAPLRNYPAGRDVPSQAGTSRLSMHLAWGQISVQRLWHEARAFDPVAAEPFVRQLAWRDFGQHLLYHFEHTPTRPLDAKFAGFPWRWPESPEGHADPAAARDFKAWCHGQTGYPLVDAGMRELWATGWMHNRLRMVVGSFLVKHLRLHWLCGARWFWDTLMDADLANNTLGWQWIAGCGADAAPYFRIFNPVTQSRRFDASGAYIRRWVPELANLDTAHLHAPWEVPPLALASAGVMPGVTYPHPIVGLTQGRDGALAAYAQMRV